MAPAPLLRKGFGLLLMLASLAASSPWHSRDVDIFPAVFARQDDPTTDAPSCDVSCDLDTCGGGACAIGGSASLRRRSFDDLGSLLDSFASINVSNVYEIDAQELSKRIWRFDPASTDPVGDRLPEVEEVDRYLPAVIRGGENSYFGGPLWLSTGDERAYSQQVVFGNRPFQIMTGGIHGCMTVTLVSNRAVWMAHFWESYSHGKPNKDTPATDPAFIDRVLKFIRGETVDNPAPSTYVQAIHRADGPEPRSLFNDDDDETKLFISTPIATGASLSSKNPRLKYPSRVSAMETEFRRRLGRKPQIVRILYQRLDYSNPDDEALENNSNRGMHLFQYDPNSNNNGQRSWRLFSEARYTVKNLP